MQTPQKTASTVRWCLPQLLHLPELHKLPVHLASEPEVTSGGLRPRRPSSWSGQYRGRVKSNSFGHHPSQYPPLDARNNHFCTSVNIIYIWMLAGVLPLPLLKSMGLTDEETGSKAKQEKAYSTLISSQFRTYKGRAAF